VEIIATTINIGGIIKTMGTGQVNMPTIMAEIKINMSSSLRKIEHLTMLVGVIMTMIGDTITQR
jgi:hypothetical protein